MTDLSARDESLVARSVRLARKTARVARGDRLPRKQLVERLAACIGLRAEPLYHGLTAHRARILEQERVDLVVDVGANVGRYAAMLRRSGYAGRIVSFEPQPEAAQHIQRIAARDPRWSVEAVALAANPGYMRLFAADDSQSSSLLQPIASEQHRFAFLAGSGAYDVPTRTLDEYDFLAGGEAGFLKLDVQGFEIEVLKGAAATLNRFVAIESELSLIPLYEGQPLIEDVLASLRCSGFHTVCIQRGYTDPENHHVIQVDAIFLRDR